VSLAVLVEAKQNLNQPLEPIANAYLAQYPIKGLEQVELVSVTSGDQRTVRVRMCSLWRPIFPSYMFSDIGRVCSEGLARRGR
jgi:hypothetical protein